VEARKSGTGNVDINKASVAYVIDDERNVSSDRSGVTLSPM
jgi:hypothetical protein